MVQQQHQAASTNIAQGVAADIFVIEVPPKVWRPKMLNKYKPIEYSDDIDDGVFDFETYGRAVFRPKTRWTPGDSRDDIIEFIAEKHSEELTKNFKVGENVSQEVKERLITIIKKYWDCFCAEGARRPILGYEFGIDTGDAKPVCCRKKQYGPYESGIIMTQINALLSNDWIYECGGPYGSLIVLAPKPHQEHIDNIEKFVWRMCVSYRQLNAITKPFEYPIPRCDDAIAILIVGGEKVYIITVDARQGYHQVAVRLLDQEKLAFFAPNNKKYTWKVMPFGPTNAPAFYTAMMGAFQGEWEDLFLEQLENMSTIGGDTVTIKTDGSILIGTKNVRTGSKVIIDDILLWSNNLELILLYFECICQVFKKYRVSFRLDKCEFLKERVEYVGHDLTPTGNCPAKSKFDLISDWKLPTTGQSLHSFVGLVKFYARYRPYFEIKIKPMRALIRAWYRTSIPLMAWSPDLISLFEELKRDVTSSPILTRFNPSQPVFLKTDWSAEGMGWILMQPAQDEDSQAAVDTLRQKGDCLFDLKVEGPRLQPVAYGSRSCTIAEKTFHSFVGEAACGRWAISQNRKFLWGTHFYWMCDCNAVREILEYEGNIAMVSRWAQELLGYHFTVIHRSARMMVDVDGLTRRFGKAIAEYVMIAHIMSRRDQKTRPEAYRHDFKSIEKPTKASNSHADVDNPLILLTHAKIKETIDMMEPIDDEIVGNVLTIRTDPIRIPLPTSCTTTRGATIRQETNAITEAVDAMEIIIVTIDDVTGSLASWTRDHGPLNVLWTVHNMFTTTPNTRMFDVMFSLHERHPIISLRDIPTNVFIQMHMMEATFIPHQNGSVHDWLDQILMLFKRVISTAGNCLRYVTCWIRKDFFSCPIQKVASLQLKEHLSEPWEHIIQCYNTAEFGDSVSAFRVGIHIHLNTDSVHDVHDAKKPTASLDQYSSSYGNYIVESMNDVMDEDLVPIPFEIMKQRIPSTTDRSLPFRICTTHTLGISNNQNKSDVLDPEYPAREPNKNISEHTIFGNRFGIPFKSSDNAWYARAVSTLELLRMYSISENLLHNPKLYLNMHHDADVLLPSCIPSKFRQHYMESTTICSSLLDPFIFSEDGHLISAQCFFTESNPTPTLKWDQAYQEDVETKTLLALVRQQSQSSASLSPKEIQQVNMCYREHLKNERIHLIEERLVLFKPVVMGARHISLIIVPNSLRKKLFSHYHAGPSGGHMGEYKTLFRMRSRFFWPKMRSDIKTWTRGCAHCQAYNVWRNRRSELHFSWPVTVPFWIMHIDLWSPGHTELATSSNSKETKKGYLMNTMCDMSQFVISSITFDTTALQLSQLFMSDVVLSFGMCAVLVVDEGSNFKSVFQEMCSILKITCWPLARGNHKGLGVEKYHRFLNKTQAIVGNDRGTHETFVQNAKTSQYAWNSAPIDDTDVTRSMAAVGRDFRFPIDVELSPTPTLNDSTNSALFDYLRNVSNDSKFAQSIVAILVEERRKRHRDRHNKDKVQPQFQLGDVVKAHVQVSSKKSSGEVKKLSYQARGPFQITACLGHNSYEVQRYNEPNSATRKYKATELYLLPPTIFPAEPLDTMDQRFLNYEHAPIVSPLKKSLNIELYNEQHFNKPPKFKQASKDTPHTNIDKLAFLAHNNYPSIKQLHEETATTLPSIEEIPISDPVVSTTARNLYELLTQSNQTLLFIQYTPNETLRPRWYLVNVDIVATTESNPNFRTNHKYFCSFLAKHHADHNKSDECSRWWPDWYEYTQCDTTQQIIYGKRVLFRPNQIPDSTKYIEWGDEIDLSEPDRILHGPFAFEPLSITNRTRCKVSPNDWKEVSERCLQRHILPPTLGSVTSHKPNTKSQRKRKAK